jgi:hypothetical protein
VLGQPLVLALGREPLPGPLAFGVHALLVPDNGPAVAASVLDEDGEDRAIDVVLGED